LTKSQLRLAVAQGASIILFNPEHQVPAVNGVARVYGPWERTPAPVEDIPAKPARGGRKKPRERLAAWHADVRVEDMRIVAVMA
jgi:hypothetical protein